MTRKESMSPRLSRRRETKHKDNITLPSTIPTATGSFAGSITIRKPLHHDWDPFYARTLNLKCRDICRGNTHCRCVVCKQVQETSTPPYKVRAAQLWLFDWQLGNQRRPSSFNHRPYRRSCDYWFNPKRIRHKRKEGNLERSDRVAQPLCRTFTQLTPKAKRQ